MNYSYYFNYQNGKLIWAMPHKNTRHLIGQEAGTTDKDGYIRVTVNKKHTSAHAIIWEMHHGEIPEGYQVHHINRKPDDNHIDNLSLITPTENKQRVEKKKIGLSKENTWYSTRDMKRYKTAGGALMGYNTYLLGI